MRKICLITGSRAEYGLLQWIASDLSKDDGVQFQLLVTGSHLETRLGETWTFIEEDGFKIDRKIPLNVREDSPLDIARAMSKALAGVAKVLCELEPDLLVLLGDRYEILAAAEAALLLRIPVAHLHGGEITEGAIDDSMRHAITKLSHLHFASCEEHRARIIQLGENPMHVWNTGSVALDGLERLSLMTRDEFCRDLNLQPSKKLLLCTFHPETLSESLPADEIGTVLSSLEKFPDANVVWTLSNADVGGEAINSRVLSYVGKKLNQRVAVSSLGQRRYLSALVAADVVVGNSSSGIIEAPAAGTPTVNIGDRQKGRRRGPTIIDCPTDEEKIVHAISRALSPEMANLASLRQSEFGSPGASRKICDIIRSHPLERLTLKKFHNIDTEQSP
jgi:UDP-N-acetylglucosamine 2-epimerase (non-hydrolysing)/GDP/UDP-N,N'-diacetylbacillosamine 2-epimerase (hydrolysing)